MSDPILSGAFIDSLKRNNKKIRDDRAVSIAEDTQLIYKRTVEDLEVKVKRMNRNLENMLDLSPGHADTLHFPDFDAVDYVTGELKLGV